MNLRNFDSELNFFSKKKKQRSWFFWLAFWFLAILFLLFWWLFWEYKNGGWGKILKIIQPSIAVLPIKETKKDEVNVIFDFFTWLTDGRERNFLLLFQNNRELRPGGGYIGTFGIVKVKGEKIMTIDVHDTNVFDSRIATGQKPPFPMGNLLNIQDWELRDSNWSPDFPTNAQKAEYFYHLEGGEEQFDGVVAVSAEVLVSFFETLGSIKLTDYPGEYNAQNVIEKLQYQVEKGYAQQGIEEGKRKYIMKDLAKEIAQRVQTSDWKTKKELILKVEQHLNNKDIMLFFKDEEMEKRIREIGWGGEVKKEKGDFLMMVDANLSALKTDRIMQKKFNYQINFSGSRPKAKLSLFYSNPATQRDWQTTDYQTFLRVYVSNKSWLEKVFIDGKEVSLEEIVFGEELGKKFFGIILKVPLSQTRKVELEYLLPSEISLEDYQLFIQKQSGVKELDGIVELISSSGESEKVEIRETKTAVKVKF